MDYLSGQSRAAQLLGKDSDVVLTLEHALTRHLKDVRRHAFKPDKRSVIMLCFTFENHGHFYCVVPRGRNFSSGWQVFVNS